MKIVLYLLILVFSCNCVTARIKPLLPQESTQHEEEPQDPPEESESEEEPTPETDSTESVFGKKPEKGNWIGVIRFDTQVDDASVNATIELINQAEAIGLQGLIIEFNTPGGSVDAGFKLAKRMEDMKIGLACTVDPMAASMGAYLLQSCPTRIMTKRGIVMFHQPSVGGLIRGNADTFADISRMMRALERSLAEHMIRRTTFTMEEFQARTARGGEIWMLWQEALDRKVVDYVVDTTKEVEEAYRNGTNL